MNTSRRTIFVALAISLVILFSWSVYIGSWKPAIERRITILALSGSGRWLAAGNLQGKVTVWDLKNGGAARGIDFPYVPLNDLQFTPDERLLALAGKNLATSPFFLSQQSEGLTLLRDDEENYGTVRFSRDGTIGLVVTGKGLIETMDSRSGAIQLKLCCSSIYGEVSFSPGERWIVNAGHWPAIWDAHSGRLVGRLTRNRQFATFGPIVFDADRGTILMGSQDGCVYAWDLATRQQVAKSLPQSAYVVP